MLQRKTEEAAMATKRLKDLLESRKTSRDMAGSGSTSSAGFQVSVPFVFEVHLREITRPWKHKFSYPVNYLFCHTGTDASN